MPVTLQGEDLRMAYMDAPPTGSPMDESFCCFIAAIPCELLGADAQCAYRG